MAKFVVIGKRVGTDADGAEFKGKKIIELRAAQAFLAPTEGDYEPGQSYELACSVTVPATPPTPSP